MARPESIVFLVLELHHSTAALDQIFVDQVVHLLRSEDGPLLNHFDMPLGVDHLGVHAPEGRIADEIGSVVKEGGVDALAVVPAVLLDEFEGLGLDEAHEAVPLLAFAGRKWQGQERRCKKY